MSARHGDTERIVTARKRHRCEDYLPGYCWIEPGDRYVRAVCFPGDVNSSPQPWVMRLCLRHAGRES